MLVGAGAAVIFVTDFHPCSKKWTSNRPKVCYFLPSRADFKLVLWLGQGDLITALEYDISGDFLGWGDRNGRMTVLKLDADSKSQVCEVTIFMIYF